jgi:hypothetical protein
MEELGFMELRWTAIAFLACAGCAAEVAYGAPAQSIDANAVDANAASEPVIGRLKMRDRTIDLTASAFAPGRGDLPREAVAVQVMADIDPDMTSRSGSGARRESFGAKR